MKSVFKKLWVGVLAVAAMVAGACCSSKGIDGKPSKKELKARIAQLKSTIEDREMSCVYGSPEIIAEYGQETARLRRELDSLQNELKNYGKK